MAATLDFWLEFASTYSYPAAMRIGALAQAAGVIVRWRPFLLGPIFKQQGWDTSPFNLYPAKGRYMVRDCERQCAALGIDLVHLSREIRERPVHDAHRRLVFSRRRTTFKLGGKKNPLSPDNRL